MAEATAQPTPQKVMQIMLGAWSASILGAAVRNGIFTALESGPQDAASVARASGISPRGAQALLDGITGLGLVTLSAGRYQNTQDASIFLVQGKPAYLGAMAELQLEQMETWRKLPEAAKTGRPVAPQSLDHENNPFWEALVPAIAALALPVAQFAAARLKIADAGAVSWLDVGGGSGIWSAIWLGANPNAKGVHLDWPNVNRLARSYVGNFGVADRFHTVDGDFHTTDFGSAQYDFAIYSNIAHQEVPEDNIAVFRKFRKALKPGGTLVVSDFILNDDRTGNPMAMMFAAQMLIASKGGNTYRQADYRAWAAEAGFRSAEIVATPSPSSLVFAS